jgi:hypothetical protein
MLFQLFVFILMALVLLWFGFTLFFRMGKTAGGNGGGSPQRLFRKRHYKPDADSPREGGAGSPRCCPVCGVLLLRGEQVKSSAFPDPGNGQGRLMHIEGCIYCLEGYRTKKRKCPVCGAPLDRNEILFARMFEKPGRSHVHDLGCSCCYGPGSAGSVSKKIR